ncbi:hemoglobin subunit beta-2 [Microcaecilia unicolor]|uniref:Hemoglobin subunit beta-2-like n=1 Tax=Microcaecilia unicolor TaxID=1415580 RepID=A0A6P7YUG2_9AMPH|nr:hemoglobin subunit beta-2-like [Microcaecilia unicolor]
MVHWTDDEVKHVHDIFSKITLTEVGGDALARLLVVYPWCQRYFTSFGNLGSEDSICHNAQVKAHGLKVLSSIAEAANHLSDIKGFYTKLSKHHSEKLHVDPANFMLFARILLCTLARHCPKLFDADVQHACNKYLRVCADALGKQYH